MRFFGTYGCSATNSIYNIVIDATDIEAALHFCYDSAIEDRDSYEESHGVQSWAEIAEDEGFVVDKMSSSQKCYIDDLYSEAVENDIIYNVVPFDIDIEDHLETLREQEGVFWKV